MRMNILALDTSSQAASCAILRGGALAGEFFSNVGLTHSQTAMPMAQKLLEQTRIALSEIDLFAVSTGPGSFTGLRIGIASIKGMAMATGKTCVGVSTLLTLASGVCLFEGYICPVMDARRDQVYTALFESDGARLHRLREDEALSLEELGAVLDGLSARVLLVGDGAHICLEALGKTLPLTLPPERFLHQRASAVAFAACEMAARGQLTSAGELAPGYLRLSQAERGRMESAER